MGKLVPVRPKTLAKLLSQLGFVERDAEGSHVFFAHADGRTTTLPMHRKEIGAGLLRKILRDIELSPKEYDVLRLKL